MGIFESFLALFGQKRRKTGEKSSIFDSTWTEFFTLERGQETRKDYNTLALLFASNPYLYRAMMYFASACAGVNWKLYKNAQKKRELPPDNPLYSLLARPNPHATWTTFFEEILLYRIMTGNSYIALSGPNNGLPTEMYCLRPDRVTVEIDSTMDAARQFIYRIGNQSQIFDEKKCLQWKCFNPLDDFYGLSPLGIAALTLQQMKAGDEWNLALLENSGRPSGALVVNGVLSPNAAQELKRSIREAYAGRQNAGRPVLLEGGIDWKQFSLSPLDTDWSNLETSDVKKIALLIGIPPEVLGDSQNKTFANYSEARKSLYEETVLPTLDNFRDTINPWLSARFNAYTDYDKDDIEALQEDRNETVTRVNSQFAAGYITINEAREATGYDLLEDGDYINTKNAVLTHIDDMASAGLQEQANPATQTSQHPLDQLQSLLNSYAEMDTKMYPVPEGLKAAYWKAIDDRRERWQDYATGKFNKYFKSQEDEIVSLIEAAKSDEDEDVIMKPVEAYINGTQDQLLNIIYDVWKQVSNDFGNASFNALKSTFPLEVKGFYDFWKHIVSSYLRHVAGAKITAILDTTRNQIRTRLIQGVKKGESLEQMAKGVRNLIKSYYTQPDKQPEKGRIISRAGTIARTEVISSSNAGVYAGALQTGLKLNKEWISTPDKRTREWHADANGQIVPMDKPFRVDNEDLNFPGDGSLGASAENLINCRCVPGFIPLRDSQGNALLADNNQDEI